MYHPEFEDSAIQTWRLVQQTREAMQKSGESKFSHREYSTEIISMLHFISRYPDGVTLEEMAEWAFRRRHTMSRFVDRSEKLGLLERKKFPGRKTQLFCLSPKGTEVYEEYFPMGIALAKTLRSKFSEEELQQFCAYLQRARDLYLADMGIRAIPPRKPDKPADK